MRTGRPKKALEIPEEDREKLRMMALRAEVDAGYAMRARIALNCGQGMSNSEVARKLHIISPTVGKWRESLTQNASVRIWRAFGLRPHRVENFKFSKGPQFVERVGDIVGLYLNPPDRAIVTVGG